MTKRKIEGLAVTFDDVLLIPSRSKVLPAEVNLRTRLVGEIYLNLPIVSSAMDTVTESQMAIAMARLGGIGIIHKGCPITFQAEQVSLVKRSQSGLITKPYHLSRGSHLSDVLNLMNRYGINGVPIVADGKLIGLITHRDIRFLPEDENLPVEEIMIPRQKLTVGGPKTTLEEAKQILQKHRIEKLPLVDAQNNLVGLITVKDILRRIEYPLAVTDKKGRLLVGAAVGASADLKERAAALKKAGVDVFCLDSSHGHHEGVLKAISWIKKSYPEIPLIGGNVSTKEGADDLIKAGADAVKVGQGPGSICTTRAVTGAGMPQITAIMEAFETCQNKDIPVIADGGIRYSGDITKALAAGASTVMIGSLLAGTDESPGEIITIHGRPYKLYRGMGSISAMSKGGADRYFQDGVKPAKLVAEGMDAAVPTRGPVADQLYQLCGGLRSGMGMVGAHDISSLWNAKIVQVTNAGSREGHPHDVVIIREAPNYQIQQEEK